MNEECPKHDPAIRTIAMPADTNPAGDIFGGWLMAQMDLAAEIWLHELLVEGQQQSQ